MKKFSNYSAAIASAAAMLILILDSKTAFAGGAEGVKLCIEVLVPSLLPFFVVSNMLLSSLAGRPFPVLRPLERHLRVPEGSAYILLLGLLGGYPTGAQAVGQARRTGLVSNKDAGRLLAFCSNAGPSFLFGMGARLFPSLWYCWLLWAIHILSAWVVCMLTPGIPENRPVKPTQSSETLVDALKKAVQVMALVCGWVILFRVIIAFAQRWFLWLLPEAGQILVTGLLELSNGCCALADLERTGLRFVLFSIFLAFGGLCVTLQTHSVAQGTELSLYMPGKLTQAAISLLLCIPAQLLMPLDQRVNIPMPLVLLCILVCAFYGILLGKKQKNSSIYAEAGV